MNLAHMSGLTSEELPAGWQERLGARTRVVAIVAMLGTEPVVEIKKAEGLSPSPQPIVKTPGRLDPQSVKVLTDRMQPDGTFEWDVPGGQWQLFVFFQQPLTHQGLGALVGHNKPFLTHSMMWQRE